MDTESRVIHVARLKKGLSTMQLLRADELRKYGDLAGLDLPAHPRQLRHACSFVLVDQGADTRLIQDYPGHRDIRHTVIYTATNPARFERLWR